jgi:hypothetical protein
MSEEKLKKIDKNKLPFFYRLILKVPRANFLGSVFFWNFLGYNSANIFGFRIFLKPLLAFIFSISNNIVLTSIIPVAILIVFVRISLERFINWWNLNVGESSFKWNVEETMQEYLAILNKKEENE